MMKRNVMTFAGALLIAVAATSCNTAPKQEGETTTSTEKSTTMEAKDLNVDLASSQVNWRGEMLGLYDHHGTIDISSASVTVSGSEVVAGEFVIDMGTINPTDENYSEDRPKENLVGHLSAPDFFDVANHPTASFVIKESSGSTVTGDLTIRGITHEETFESVTVSKEGEGYKISGELVFDRKKYDVSFDMSVPDRVLSKDIEIGFSLMAS